MVSLVRFCDAVWDSPIYLQVWALYSRHLEKHILTPKQHGFRKHHSCTTELILATHDWAKYVDAGRDQVDIAIFDFSKAFDTVPHHERLKAKLHMTFVRDSREIA